MNFGQIYGRLHGVIRTCISDLLAFNVTISFNSSCRGVEFGAKIFLLQHEIYEYIDSI